MSFIPTTEVLILGLEEGEDAYGDPVDTYARSRAKVPAHIGEKRASVPDPSSGSMIILTNHSALLPGHTQIERGWRIKDLKTETTYVVERVRRRSTFIGASPVRLDLQLVE